MGNSSPGIPARAPGVGHLVGHVAGDVLTPRARMAIAIDGPSGAGKSTLADRLRTAVLDPPGGVLASARAETDIAVVSMDSLYRGWDGLEAGVSLLIEQILRPYAAGAERITYETWDWTHERGGPRMSLGACGLLIVEGVGSGARAARPLLDLLIWVNAPTAIRKSRALARDGDGFAGHWDAWARSEHAHHTRERTDGSADVRLWLP